MAAVVVVLVLAALTRASMAVQAAVLEQSGQWAIDWLEKAPPLR